MTALNKNEFLAPKDRQQTQFDLAPYGYDAGSYVCIRTLTSREAANLVEIQKQSGDIEFMTQVLCRCICDDSGNNLFDSDSDIDALLGKRFDLLKDLTEAALDLNGFGDDDAKKN